MQGRKKFLVQLGSGLLGAGLPFAGFSQEDKTPMEASDFNTEAAPDDEAYWNRISKKYYEVSPDHINLENGYYGAMSKPVLEAFQKNVALTNQGGSVYARREYPAIAAGIKKQVADFLQVSDEEIIITRNATEALNIAIQGYPFQAADEVLINQLDYFSMVETFRMLEQKGQIKVKAFDMPLLPQSEDEIVALYQKQITPKTKVILLTQVSNINGLIVPIAKIAAMAKQKGIDIICDSAHALGQIAFSLPGLGADFVGLNLHKWIGNPVGAGVLYVKKERIKDLQPLFGDTTAPKESINKLAHFGTMPFAIMLTIPDSLAFHRMLGVEKISARLHYLKRLWMEGVKDHRAISLVTPIDSSLSCAIASFSIPGKKPAEVTEYLFQHHRILTIGRKLGTEGCIRVTPAIYNTAEEVQQLSKALMVYTGS